jgi:hypothetical protein
MQQAVVLLALVLGEAGDDFRFGDEHLLLRAAGGAPPIRRQVLRRVCAWWRA